MFRIYDDDDAGLISQQNLERCARDLEETEPPLTKQESHMMILMADKDKKGGVDHDDFMNLMRELGLIGEKKNNKPISPLGSPKEL